MTQGQPIKIILAFVLAISFQCNIFACSCFPYISEFCNIVDTSHYIVRVEVTGHPDLHLMTVDVVENMHREIPDTSLTILGQDGFNCGETLEYFDIGDVLILAVSKSLDIQSNEWFWYLEGACGLHYLRYEDEMVQGQITETMTEQSLEDFIDGLFDCISDVVNVEEVLSKNEVSIFPNPVESILNIEVENQQILRVEIFDSNSNLLVENNKLQNYFANINLHSLRSGVYFVRIRTSKVVLTRKFFKI